jgi:hypothetical protein
VRKRFSFFPLLSQLRKRASRARGNFFSGASPGRDA